MQHEIEHYCIKIVFWILCEDFVGVSGKLALFPCAGSAETHGRVRFCPGRTDTAACKAELKHHFLQWLQADVSISVLVSLKDLKVSTHPDGKLPTLAAETELDEVVQEGAQARQSGRLSSSQQETSLEVIKS
jgi:hypothetical protein